MKNTTLQIATVAASLVLAATFIAWRVTASRAHSAVHFGIVKDRSGSMNDGCQGVVGLAQGILNARGISADTTLTILLTGDATTAYEPTLMGSYPIPFSTKAIEGRGAIRRQRDHVLKDLLVKCQAAGSTDVSPIFLAVRQAIADLRGKGCDAAAHCHMDVDTDLEENVEAGIKSLLNGSLGRKPPMPNVIDNADIAVRFCGLAATTGITTDSTGRRVRKSKMRDSAREDRLKATWISLFSDQNLVSFEPYCRVLSDVTESNMESNATFHN